MTNQKIREAVKLCKIIECIPDLTIQQRENIAILISLAQQVLDAKMPKDKEIWRE